MTFRAVIASLPIRYLTARDAAGAKLPRSNFDQTFADTVAVTLRFSGDRLAQLNLPYCGNPTNTSIALGDTEASNWIRPRRLLNR
jgi:hypothetical protein